jgi:hypothetical protein
MRVIERRLRRLEDRLTPRPDPELERIVEQVRERRRRRFGGRRAAVRRAGNHQLSARSVASAGIGTCWSGKASPASGGT